MGIESGSRGIDSYRPEVLETCIEGKVESTFGEVDIDQASHIPLPNHIKWPGVRLSFQKVGTYPFRMRFRTTENIPLYSGKIVYKDGTNTQHVSPLSLLISQEKPVLFTGTTNGFYAHDPLMAGKDLPFYVVGLDVEELSQQMSRLSALWHELGHVVLFDSDADIQLLHAALTLNADNLPNIAASFLYANDLVSSLPPLSSQPNEYLTRQQLFELGSRSYRTDKSIRLFHERNAWAAGMHLVNIHQYPIGFEKKSSFLDYARFCLATYARYYEDRRFTEGLSAIHAR